MNCILSLIQNNLFLVLILCQSIIPSISFISFIHSYSISLNNNNILIIHKFLIQFIYFYKIFIFPPIFILKIITIFTIF